MHALRTIFFVAVAVAILGCSTSPRLDSNIPVGAEVVRSEDAHSPVKLELYHESDLPIGPGFSVYISGWEPNDLVNVLAYNENKEKIDIVVGDQRLEAASDGTLSFSLPYRFRAFHPGRWLIVVEGKSGTHAHYVDIPQP